MLPEMTVFDAPASLRASVLDAIDEVRPRPPSSPSSAPSRRRRGAALVAAAAAFIAIGGVGATIWHPWSDDTSQAPTLTAGGCIGARRCPVMTELPDGHRQLARSESLNGAVVQTSDMAPAGDGRSSRPGSSTTT